MLTVADCDAINTQIVRESGRISPEIYNRVVRSTPWIALTPRDTFPDGMGIVQTNMLFERMLPNSDDEEWANIAPSDGTSNNCLPPTEILEWGQTLRTWQLQKIAKQTEDFCLEDLRSAFELQKVLQNYSNGLTTVTRWVWENRDRNEYVRLCGHQITEGAAGVFDINATAFDPANPPTSPLTWGTLEQVYAQLMREGVEGMGVNGSGAPVLGLMSDEVTIRGLLRADPELREDFRFAYMGTKDASPLLQAFFTTGHSYNGYKPMTDFYPQRFEIVGGAYVRIKPFADATATTKGTKRDLNLDYIYATYQVTPVHVPQVFTQRVPEPMSAPGGSFKFDAVDYMGDFKWKNIPHAVCNPDGTIGFFRAVFASASEPVHPEYGYSIMHLNCPPQRALRTCYEDYQ